MRPTIYVVASCMAAGALTTTARAQARDTLVTLDTPTGVLHGTLLVPERAKAPTPVALIIAGSGPTDRNGNTPLAPGANNSLKMLAETLASQGVASLRFDKRGVAASAGAATSEADLRFTTFVDDAVAWSRWLRDGKRFSTLTIVGHSEGALIGAMAADRGAADRFVSIAGAGRPASEVLEEQLARNLPPPLLEESRRIMRELLAGRTVSDVPQPLAALYRPSVQPYMISWLGIDPAAEYAKLAVPTLVIQGTTDVQVGEVDGQRLAKANPKATLALIEGMNHVLKEVREPAQQQASYSNPELPLHPELVAVLKHFDW